MTPDIPITFRNVKGSPLTAAEVDANFAKLKEAILAVAKQYDCRIVIGAEPAAGERVGVLWVPEDFRAIYVWDANNGEWKQMLDPKLWAMSTNVGDDFAITIPGDYADINALQGRVIAFQASATCTGVSTLKVNGFSKQPIKRTGTNDLSAGEIRVGVVYLVVFDGTVFQLMNPTEKTFAEQINVYLPQYFTSALSNTPKMGSPVEIGYPFEKAPQMLRMVLVCKSLGSGFEIGDVVDSTSFTSDENAGDEDDAAFTIVTDPVHKRIVVCLQTCNYGIKYVSKSGVRSFMSQDQMRDWFDLQIHAMLFPTTVTVSSGAPIVTSQPSNVSVTAPASATFTVVASGATPISYQWRKDGINIPGATAASLTINPTIAGVGGSSGAYSCILWNAVGSVVSNNATLTVA